MPFKHETDAATLERLQKGAFSYFLHACNPDNGLIADTSSAGSPCSIAATGFALSCYPIGVERGWMSHADAVQRTLTVLRFLASSEQSRARDATGYKGLYYHFLDMNTGQRVWKSELSLIDSALLLAGVLTAVAYFSAASKAETEIRDLGNMLYARANWQWALDGGDTLAMGWKPRGGFLPHRWEGYSEALLLYILALASPSYPIPEECYRAFAREFEWLTIKDRPFLYAGPLFIHLFPQAWIDFRGLRDAAVASKETDYFENTCRAIAVQRDYAERNPGLYAGYGKDVWGLTACDGPERPRKLVDGRRQPFAGYAARGAPYGPDDGTLAPWAPLACLPFAPEAALSATRRILSVYPDVLVDGGFIGSFNPSIPGPTPTGWMNTRRVALDQGLLVMMIENHLTGQIWDMMRELPLLKRGLKRAGFSGGWLAEPA